MEKRENNHRVKFTKIACFILFILLCAAPCKALFVYNQTVDIDYGVDSLTVFMGTANLYQGAIVYKGISALSGSEINFYGGQLGTGYISAFGSTSIPKITVYGRNFAVYVKVNGQIIDELELSGPSFTLVPGKYFNLVGFYGNGDPINLTFYGNIPIYLVTLESQMVIDIKPGDEQNNINLKSNGVVPVAVLTTEQFEAAEVDPATAEFAGAAPQHWSLEDVDGDGDSDVIFHFRTQELDLDEESTEATLTAQLKSQMVMLSAAQASGGTVVSGTDAVRIVTAKKSKK